MRRVRYAASLYECLKSFYGPSNWWPGETPFEVIVGAVLTQNTAWKNVERAINNIKRAGLLDFSKMNEAEDEMISHLIKPSGYFNIKTRRLKNLLAAISESGGLEQFFRLDEPSMRSMLLKVKGIGEETADSICCYAAGKMCFVVDSYTKRILTRHGLADENASYGDMQRIFVNGLPRNLQVYKDMHAYIVFVGKEFCRKSRPKCEDCPVSGIWGKPS